MQNQQEAPINWHLQTGSVENHDADAEGFQMQRQQRWSKKRDRIVVGNKKDNRLRSGSGKVTIIIKYVHKQFECDNIKKYLTDESVQVENIELVSHPDSLTKSFKVDITYDNKTKVMSEDFWPTGVGCRLWRTKRTQQGDQQRAPLDVINKQENKYQAHSITPTNISKLTCVMYNCTGLYADRTAYI